MCVLNALVQNRMIWNSSNIFLSRIRFYLSELTMLILSLVNIN